jgi:alkylhydroperoxidase/carboxymuconolactone decarboxylase family protein YurZ
LPEKLANLPPDVKRKIEEMKAAGASDEELKAVLQQALAGGGAPPQQGAPTGAPIQ